MSDYAQIMEENKALKAEIESLKARLAEAGKPKLTSGSHSTMGSLTPEQRVKL